MLEDFRQRHDEWRAQPASLVALDLLLEILLMTVTELSDKLDAIQTGVNAVKAELAALKNQPPPAATQDQIDALGAKADAIQAALNA